MAKEEENIWLRLESRFRKVAWGIGGLLLLAPLIAMQFTDEVNWTMSDFVFATVLIGGVGLLYELAARSTGGLAYRAAVGIALAATFLLVWVNGAVGIIGSENNPANGIFAGVLAVGIIGALLARFRPAGMAYARLVTALAQALVGAIAFLAGWGYDEPAALPPYVVIPAATGVFTGMWLLSAWLFGSSARRQTPTAAAPSL
jgi:hypothetical protein